MTDWGDWGESEQYEPHPFDVLLPGNLLVVPTDDAPMFRYRIKLTYKIPDTPEDECVSGRVMQMSWPLTELPRIVADYGGLDRFLRAQCRNMLMAMLSDMWPDETDITELRSKVFRFHGVVNQTPSDDGGQGQTTPSLEQGDSLTFFPPSSVLTLGSVSYLGHLPI